MEPNRLVQSGEVELAVYTWGEDARPTARGASERPARDGRAGLSDGARGRAKDGSDSVRPTVVLVHGYPDAASVWKASAERLAEKYYVVAYDVRGAGRSTRPDHTAAYDLDHLVGDLAAVVDAVSPDRPVHLVCHDWGSIQCWEAVATERMKGRIASYTSISGPSLDHAGYWIMQRLKSGSPEKLAQVARQLAHSWYIGMFHLPALAPAMWKSGLDKLWPSILETVEGFRPEASATQAEDGRHGVNLYRANFAKRVLKPQERRTNLPVQLIVPTRDNFMVREIWDDLPQWAPNVWRRDVDAGHWLQSSHPELVADWAAEFIDFVEGGAQTTALRRARLHPESSGKPYSRKLVVVTGAGSGIGRETLLLFAEQGAAVVAADIDLPGAERSAELARLLGVDAHARKIDVGSADDMEAFAAWVERELGTPDIVVNNAGIGMAGPVLDTSVADWEKILRVNLWGVIHGSRLFGKQMLAAGKRGHIVNVSSGLAFFPTKATPAYATSKAAVQMLTECLRADLADKRIGVSAVYPGVVDTGIVTRTRFVGTNAAEEQRLQTRTQRLYQKRNLRPAAVAAAILKAVEKNQAEVLVGSEVHGIRLISRLLPGLARRLARVDLAP